MKSNNLVYGANAEFEKLMSQAGIYAETDWPVLIMGETGVGKELIARYLHDRSRRRGKFIPINCAAIPPNLFESELFGHTKGAFSGASHFSKGLIREAEGGTLFLDEIGELDVSLQVKFLRVMERGEVRSIGSSRTEETDVRFITATNVDLYHAVKLSRFRLDLLQRLAVLRLQVPPLRDRLDDIPLIANKMLSQLGCAFDDGVFALLQSYDWPGNIRQLKNVLSRAAAVGHWQVTSASVKEILEEERRLTTILRSVDDVPLSEGTLEELERQIIVNRLRKCNGNRKLTAKALGIAKSTLHEKLRRWRNEKLFADDMVPPPFNSDYKRPEESSSPR